MTTERDSDVPKLQRMRANLARGVREGEFEPSQALSFLHGYVDALHKAADRRRTWQYDARLGRMVPTHRPPHEPAGDEEGN